MKKILLFSISILIFLSYSFSLATKNIFAQGQFTPFPQPTVPCDSYRNDQFHSLRPYQASPCNPEAENLALFCGNDFILIDEIVIRKVYSPASGNPPFTWEYIFEGNPITPVSPQPGSGAIACGRCTSTGQCVVNRDPPCIPYPDLGCDPATNTGCNPGECIPNADGTQERCTFVIERDNHVVINLGRSELPIKGYTEPSIGNTSDPYQVVNSQTQPDPETVTDAQKVNEYVSWYMNGLIGRAEYDPPEKSFLGLGGLTEEGEYRIVNFSGPLKRLLSWESQIVRRINELNKLESDDIRHDQIIGCMNWAGNLLLSRPRRCYPGNPAIHKVSLNYWRGLTIAGLPITGGTPPPLQRDYSSFSAFWAAYKLWQVTTLNQLFSYIPFSSTEDRKGFVEFGTYTIQPPSSSDVVILSSRITDQEPGDLFFPHMQENFELARLFQKIYAPEDVPLNKDPEPDRITVSREPYCDLIQVRSNPGDALFGTQASATVEYSAQVTCTFTIPGDGRLCRSLGENINCHAGVDYCQVNYGRVDCGPGEICGRNCGRLPTDTLCTLYFPNNECYPSSVYRNCVNAVPNGGEFFCGSNDFICAESCQLDRDDWGNSEICREEVPVALQVITNTPLISDIWKRLVAGPASVFRRLFPQIRDEEGRPIKRIWDIPTMTNAVYSSSDGNTVLAGNPNGGRPGSQAQIYFPHIGAIHEYFLNCIQKTLRPKGYGQGCISGPEPLVGTGTCQNVYGWGIAGCSIGTGLCDPDDPNGPIARAGFTGCRALQASMICNGESGGNPLALNCQCLNTQPPMTLDYSVGLFQINLLAHCPGAFEYNRSWVPMCRIVNQSLMNECLNRFYDPLQNAQYAYRISQGGTNWTPWGVYTTVCRNEVDALCQ